MTSIYLEEFQKLETLSYIDLKFKNEIKDFILHNEVHTKPQNMTHHFGVYMVPIYLPGKQIFLGHHIKADSWIPPGGHIEYQEFPLDTLQREFKEELSFKLTTEKRELFDMTVKHLHDTRPTCRVHYDFWSVVYLNDKINFEFDKGEFYDMKWFGFTEGLQTIIHTEVKSVLKNLFQRLEG